MTLKRGGWLFWVIILAGFIIGTAIGMALKSNSDFSLLSQGFDIGWTDPFTFSLGFISLTFGFYFTMNVGGAIGIILAALIYKAIF